MSTLVFYAQFTASKIGKNSITVTWDIERITRSDGTRNALVTAGANSVTVGRRGLYGYVLTNADLTLYDYVATAITADATVDVQEIPALWTLYSTSWHDVATSGLNIVGSIGKWLMDLPDLIWDEVLTGATHNIASSAGRRLRQIASVIVIDGTSQGAGVNGNQIILANDASSTNGAYDPALIAIVSGTGAGQCRLILEYVGSTRTATVDRDWKVLPDVTSEYIVYADAGREHVNEGLAQTGTSNTITLNINASAFDDAYVHQTIFIRSGTGSDQVRTISAYNGTTKIATVTENWDEIPDNTSAYVILPTHVHEPSEIATSVWTSPTRTLSSFGTLIADIWSYVTRTLTSGGSITAQQVWEYATRTLTQQVTINVDDVWEYPRRTLTPPDNKYSTIDYVVDTDWELTKGITNKTRFLLGDLTNVVDIVTTAKYRRQDTDADSIFQIRYTTGLEVLNGAPYAGTITDGKFTILDITTGLVELEINYVPSADLIPTQNKWFDIKTYFASDVLQPVKGYVSIEWDVTRAVS
jgi:hypothetical protein